MLGTNHQKYFFSMFWIIKNNADCSFPRNICIVTKSNDIYNFTNHSMEYNAACSWLVCSNWSEVLYSTGFHTVHLYEQHMLYHILGQFSVCIFPKQSHTEWGGMGSKFQPSGRPTLPPEPQPPCLYASNKTS